MKKRIFIVVLTLLLLILSITSCTTSKVDKNQSSNGNQGDDIQASNNSVTAVSEDNKEKEIALGRYIEADVPLPPEVKKIYAIRELNNGELLLISSTTSSYLQCYTSNDKGDTWSEHEYIESSVLPENHAIIDASINAEGTIFISYGLIEGESTWGTQTSLFCSYRKINSDGTFTDIDLNTAPGSDPKWTLEANAVSITKDGDGLFVNHTEEGVIYCFLADQEDGSVTGSYEILKSGQMSVTESSIIIKTRDGLIQFDSTTGEEIGLLDLPNELADKANDYISEGEDQTYIIANNEGIYRFRNDSNVMEQLLEGSFTTLYNNEYYPLFFCPASDQEYFIIYQETYLTPYLKRYYYDPESPAAPDKEITVYSLYRNEDLQNIIFEFQKQNPDYHIIYEIGTNNDTVTETTEIIKLLNTEILAGNGPDVLILNGLPLDSYLERGVLQDLSPLLESYTENDELFENITNIYKHNDTINAIPISFKVPVTYGNQQARNTVTDIEGLASYLASSEVSSFAGEAIIADIWSAESILLKLSEIYGDKILSEDSINENELKTFFTNAKKIYDIVKSKWPVYFNEDSTNERGEYESTDVYYEERGVSNTMVALTRKEHIMLYGYMNSIIDLVDMEYGKEKLLGYDYQLVHPDIHYFMPAITVGLNIQASEPENGLALIDFMLSEDGQRIINSYFPHGLPVNKAIFRESMAIPDDDTLDKLGTNLEDFKWASQESFDKFENIVNTLDTLVFMDSIIFNELYEQAILYFTDEKSLESAVTDFTQRMNIYLAE